MRVTLGKLTRDKEGRHGVTVHLDFDTKSYGFAGHAKIATHGKTPEEVSRFVDEIAFEYIARCEKLTALSTGIGLSFTIDREKFTITDCTLRPRGDNVELYAVAVSDNDRLVIQNVYRSASVVPIGAEVLRIFRDLAATNAAERGNADEHVKAVRKALGIG